MGAGTPGAAHISAAGFGIPSAARCLARGTLGARSTNPTHWRPWRAWRFSRTATCLSSANASSERVALPRPREPPKAAVGRDKLAATLAGAPRILYARP